MQTTDPDKIEAAKAAFIREFHRQQIRAALSIALTLAVALVLYRGVPQPWNAVAMGFGGALYMTGFLVLRPDSMRSRTGSKLPAIGLVTFLWTVAILATVTVLMAGR